ncbi:MAG: STN domain-containing protein [Planctomycetaceae bacterium]
MAILFGGMLAIGALLDAPPAASQEFDEPSRPPSAEILAEQTEIAFAETPLEIAIQLLADLHDVPIVIDKASLQAAKIDPELEVDRVVSGITLESGLNIILDEHGLDWFIRDGKAIVVTTPAAAAKELQTKGYPLGGLKSHGIAPTDVLRALDELLGVRKTDAQDRPGRADINEEKLSVRHTRRGHAQIARLFAELEAVGSGKPIPASNRSELNRREIRSSLSELVEVSFDRVPLDVAMSVFADRHGIRIVLDRRAFPKLMDQQEPTLTLMAKRSDAKALGPALDRLLKPIDATYIIEHEVLLVTSVAAAEERPDIRVYDIREIARTAAGKERVRAAVKEIAREPLRSKTAPAPSSAEIGDSFLIVAASAPRQRALEAVLAALRSPGGYPSRD